jgi:hypothetical protein
VALLGIEPATCGFGGRGAASHTVLHSPRVTQYSALSLAYRLIESRCVPSHCCHFCCQRVKITSISDDRFRRRLASSLVAARLRFRALFVHRHHCFAVRFAVRHGQRTPPQRASAPGIPAVPPVRIARPSSAPPGDAACFNAPLGRISAAILRRNAPWDTLRTPCSPNILCISMIRQTAHHAVSD